MKFVRTLRQAWRLRTGLCLVVELRERMADVEIVGKKTHKMRRCGRENEGNERLDLDGHGVRNNTLT